VHVLQLFAVNTAELCTRRACKHLTDLAANADSGAMLKTAFEGENAPVTLLNFVSAPEAWQPSEKELNQTGAALLNPK
jgi:hypothetical protein